MVVRRLEAMRGLRANTSDGKSSPGGVAGVPQAAHQGSIALTYAHPVQPCACTTPQPGDGSHFPPNHPQTYQPYTRGGRCGSLIQDCCEFNSHTPHQRFAHTHASPRSHTLVPVPCLSAPRAPIRHPLLSPSRLSPPTCPSTHPATHHWHAA